MRDYAQTTHLKDYISGDEYQQLQREGKLDPIVVATLNCYFCELPVGETAPDARQKQMPICHTCGVYYELQWILDNGTISIKIIPRPHRADYTEQNEISQDKPQTQTEPTQTESENKPPEHKDVIGQIRTLLHQHTHVTTKQLANSINASRQSIDYAIKKLIENGEIRKIKRGVYELIKMNTNP